MAADGGGGPCAFEAVAFASILHVRMSIPTVVNGIQKKHPRSNGQIPPPPLAAS
jgi:hypothetical protein